MTKPLHTGEFHRAVLKGHQALLERVASGFAQISKAEYQEIEERWLGAPILSREWLQFFTVGIGLLIVILAALILWLRMLKRAVAQRTFALQGEIMTRNENENLLRESELRFRTIFDASNEAIFIHGLPSGDIVDVNQTMCDMYGYSREEAIHLTVGDLSSGVAPYIQLEAVDRIRKAWVGEPQLFEWQAKDKAGRLFWVEVKMRMASIGVEDKIIAAVRDITERKLAEEELKTANEELRTVNRIIATCTGTLATKEMLDKILVEALKIVGLEGGTVCSLEPDDTLKLVTQRETSEATILELTTNRIKVGDCLCGNCAHDNCPLILPNRQAVMAYATREAQRGETINFHAAFPFTTKGKCVGVLCVFTRTEKKPSERSLKLLETLAGQVALAIENAQYYEKLQQSALEMEHRVAVRTEELVKNRAELTSQNKELLKTYHELEMETAERIRAMEELRIKGQMLIHQSRLAAMGEMVGNIAHQWRQPLNMLGLLAQDLSMTYKKGEFSTEYLEANVKKVLETIQHMSKTIDDFMYFFRPGKEKEDFRILEVIEKTISLLEGSLNALQIRTAVVASCDPIVNGYPNELSQVLLNVMVNARDAFATQQVTNPTITLEIGTEAGKCVVTITDNAGGIPEEIIGKIFDPYFTTKGPDKGTGVGLFMSKTIIEKNMGGSLSARNLDGGAQFRIVI